MADKQLEIINYKQLLNQHVVYYDPYVYVGRVTEVTCFSPEEMVFRGLVAKVSLLQADRHELLADVFYQSYVYIHQVASAGTFYRWPTDLPPQTFNEPKQPGHHLEIILSIKVYHVPYDE